MSSLPLPDHSCPAARALEEVAIWPNSTFDDEALVSLANVRWSAPEFSRVQVNAAGKVLVTPVPNLDVYEHALRVINNWRSSHSFPLNTIQIGLRRISKDVDKHSLVAQRIKRLSSIEMKLRLLPSMKLSQMQDIGGCRSIVNNVAKVRRISDYYIRRSRVKHILNHVDDYISTPRISGYRGVHLIYRYHSDRNETYNGLKIEMQLRSRLQHAWATAVETVGTLTKQALKSSLGQADWLRFFSLMGTEIAIRERTNLVPDTPKNKKTLSGEIRRYAISLGVINQLRAIGSTLEVLGEKELGWNPTYFLLALEQADDKVTIYGFNADQLEEASQRYLEIERKASEHPGTDAVLVSVESLEALRRAYPNYFLDTRVFIEAVQRAIS